MNPPFPLFSFKNRKFLNYIFTAPLIYKIMLLMKKKLKAIFYKTFSRHVY